MECPGCNSADFTGSYIVRQQPVILNYRFANRATAQGVPRRDITLLQCVRCGLIFNSAFESGIVPYDANYENTQCCSPAFHSYLEKLARDLITRRGLRNKRILEVGCGKGDFLKIIAQLGPNEGCGYDTTYEGASILSNPKLQFHREYITADRVPGAFDYILCRHVIEHVPSIQDFLIELRKISAAAGNPTVLLETPRFEWIFEQGSFWDIFYEHCNYYAESTLRMLCERAGFNVVLQERTFGDQYQVLELKGMDGLSRLAESPAKSYPDLNLFRDRVNLRQVRLMKSLEEACLGGAWGIWGAGAKGVAIVNQLSFKPPAFVVDANPAKQGCVIPGSSVPIIAPEDDRIRTVSAILIANPVYLREIELSLQQVDFKNEILTA
jgi:SAM-dependent methyltransferase